MIFRKISYIKNIVNIQWCFIEKVTTSVSCKESKLFAKNTKDLNTLFKYIFGANASYILPWGKYQMSPKCNI